MCTCTWFPRRWKISCHASEKKADAGGNCTCWRALQVKRYVILIWRSHVPTCISMCIWAIRHCTSLVCVWSFFFLRSGKSKRGREFGDSSLHRSERCRLQGPDRELGLLTAPLYTVQMYSSASPSTCDHLTNRSRAETPSVVHATPVCLCTVSLWCSLYHSSTPCKNTPNWVSVKVLVISKRRHIYQNI